LFKQLLTYSLHIGFFQESFQQFGCLSDFQTLSFMPLAIRPQKLPPQPGFLHEFSPNARNKCCYQTFQTNVICLEMGRLPAGKPTLTFAKSHGE
jgi:hypothetical protein